MSFRSQSRPTRLAVETLETRDTPTTLYGLTVDNRLVQIESTRPTEVVTNVAIQVPAGERVVGIDYRPRTGELFGMGVSGGGSGNTARLLRINPLTGAAVQVGANIPLALGVPDGRFGFDFNPTVDRIRVITSNGQNLRVNPNDGTVVIDAPILLNGPVDAAAYDRNYDGKLGASGTTLYTINATTGNLHTQGTVNQVVSPNTGLQTVVGPLNTPIDPTAQVGFDISANATPGAGPAFALFDAVPGAGVFTNLYTINLNTGAATLVGAVGNGSGVFTGLAVAPGTRFAVGSGGGTEARVEVYDDFGNRLRVLTPYPGFSGGVTTAMGDVNRDGVLDVITGATAGGGPHVKVFDGNSWNELFSFFAYDAGFRGGVSVASGDINGDGFADVITGAGPGGGPHVRAFSGNGLGELASYMAYPTAFTGGVRVAAGDLNNDGVDETVTAAGPGGSPHVRVLTRNTITGITSDYTGSGGGLGNFYAYDAAFTGGVWVATGDVNGDGFADVITGADATGGPHVRVKSGRDGSDVINFYAFNEGFSGGVRVGVADVDHDGRVEVLAAPGTGLDVDVRAFDANIAAERKTFDVVDGARGAFVGGGQV